MAVDRPFSQAQDQWLENLISEQKFHDAVAILGPEGRRVPFIRVFLAALSQPLCAALYGDFKENITGEITLVDVSEDAFDVMQRSAHHLDPKLTPDRAIATLQAAKLYLIDDLSSFCVRYLWGLTPDGAFRAMTAAIKKSYPLPKDLLQSYFRGILLSTTEAIKGPAFLESHGLIIHQLIQSEVLDVDEELLWDRLVEWAGNAVRMPELLGPFAEASGECTKRLKLDREEDGSGVNERAQQTEIIGMIARQMRFAAMTKEFVFDKVIPWLPRQHSEGIISALWLDRESEDVVKNKRAGLFGEKDLVGPGLKIHQCSPRSQADQIQNLMTGSTWKPPQAGSFLEVTLPRSVRLHGVSRIELTFSQEGSLWPGGLMSSGGLDGDLVKPSRVEGRTQVFEDAIHGNVFQVRPVAQASQTLAQDAASLTKVTILKKICRPNVASEEADRLSSNTFGSIMSH